MKREKRTLILQENKSLKLAIKKNCYDCMSGMKKTDCGVEECSLYPFRPFKRAEKKDSENIHSQIIT